MPLSTRVVQICLFLFAFIALIGGTLQMILGQPTTTPRLDNVHRFMAGIYFSMGLICFWAGYTVRIQKTLVYLIGLGVWIAAFGRLVSISIVGLPEPAPLWLGYLVPELLVPPILIFSQWKRKDLD
ncbi:DUF4345 domain-containing protein [Leptospira barantonii]|uniref:DUF4345 domain-containing protein n=1 Tax=Leptospira barantonii TaxID=2023184 RepID=A0A5F2B0J1_9LEPT|nr:DUF4345 domain-containing protein [Leptospira barantonii]TGL97476.1 DUF4345 domain-containing protein [Leptospira barantonii]